VAGDVPGHGLGSESPAAKADSTVFMLSRNATWWGKHTSKVFRSHTALSPTVVGLDVERVIDEIEQLEEMFEAPDTRPFSASDIAEQYKRISFAAP
jgi:hypothetical protein